MTLVPAIYTIAVLVPPLLALAGFGGAADAVFWPFRFLCHQLPHRTLHIAGEPMAVCARCFALSLGLFAAGILSGRLWALGFHRRLPLWGIALATVPLALDGTSQLFGFRESTNTLRVLTGILLGGAVSFWSVPMVCQAFDDMRQEGNAT